MNNLPVTEKILIVVLQENCLGFVYPYNRTSVSIIAKTKGCFNNVFDCVLINNKSVRLANKNDFESFRVSLDGYDMDDEYIYEEKLNKLSNEKTI